MKAKRIVLITSILAMMLMILQGCYDVATVVDNGPAITKSVSLKDDIIPILNKSCNMAGCHNTGGKDPDLTADKAYTSLQGGKYFDTNAPEQSVLYLYLTGKKTPQMPMGGPYNPSSLNQLTLAWIKQGAKNN